MGFLSNLIKSRAEIGRPGPSLGVRPMLREPGLDIRGERSIFGQQSPFGLPLPPTPRPPVVGGPALPPVDPRIIPPRPPSIGGIGGINQPLQPVLQQPPSPLAFEVAQRQNQVGDGMTSPSLIGQEINAPVPLTEEEKAAFGPPPPPGAIDTRGITDKLSNITNPVSPPLAQVTLGSGVTPEGRSPLQKMPLPPKRDDFMSIGGPGGGFNDDRVLEQQPFVPPVDPVVTPTATSVDTPVTTIPEDPRGQVDPVLAQQDTIEMQTDPLLRALYFGTADQPGYLNQLQQATANLIGSDVPLQQTAGLSELEQMAQDRAIADLGVAEPFVGERADLLRGTTRQFDPSMTQQFYNPYEDRVVQQTIQDVLEAGEKRDIAQRAQDIQSGGLSAFGSRARLTAADRQEALGRGLAEALGGIRQAGFSGAQRSALSTFDRQRLAERS